MLTRLKYFIRRGECTGLCVEYKSKRLTWLVLLTSKGNGMKGVVDRLSPQLGVWIF